MSGGPGTPRFGTNPDVHTDKTSASGISHISVGEAGERQTETHYAYNENLGGRSMGEAPGDGFDVQDRQADYPCNHDGYMGGNARLSNLDERKVLDNHIASVKIEFSDCTAGTTGDFD